MITENRYVYYQGDKLMCSFSSLEMATRHMMDQINIYPDLSHRVERFTVDLIMSYRDRKYQVVE